MANKGAPRPTRRAVIWTLAGWAASGMVGNFCYERILKRFVLPHERDDAPVLRSERLEKLFFGTDSFFEVTAADDDPAFPPTIQYSSDIWMHTPDFHALKTIRQFLTSSGHRQTEVVSEAMLLSDKSSHIYIGSPRSNAHARYILGGIAPHQIRFNAQVGGLRVPVAYAMCLEEATSTFRLQDGKEMWTPNYCIAHHSGRRYCSSEVTAERKLHSDHLLITRLPGYRAGTSILVVGGLHGIGTRGISNVLFTLADRDVDSLERCQRKSPFFQAVFELRDLTESGGNSVAQFIRLSRTLPPVPLHPKLR